MRLKIMSKTIFHRAPVLLSGAALLMGASALLTRVQSAPAARTTTNTAVTAVASTPDKDGFRHSETPGVSVRFRPEPSAAGHKMRTKSGGWIYVKPGAPVPQFNRMGGRGVSRVEAGRSAAGGKVLYRGEDQLPLATAHRAPSGRIELDCDQPNRGAKRHSTATKKHALVNRAGKHHAW
jgi:hypothetical protein